MPASPDIGQLSKSLDELHAQLLDAQASSGDELMRRHLGALADEIKQRHAQFVTEYQKEKDRVAKQIADVRQGADEMLAKIANAREQVAAAAAAAVAVGSAVPAPPPEPPVVPGLGRKVRDDFLSWLGQDGTGREGRAAGTDLGEAWQDWEGSNE